MLYDCKSVNVQFIAQCYYVWRERFRLRKNLLSVKSRHWDKRSSNHCICYARDNLTKGYSWIKCKKFVLTTGKVERLE